MIPSSPSLQLIPASQLARQAVARAATSSPRQQQQQRTSSTASIIDSSSLHSSALHVHGGESSDVSICSMTSAKRQKRVYGATDGSAASAATIHQQQQHEPTISATQLVTSNTMSDDIASDGEVKQVQGGESTASAGRVDPRESVSMSPDTKNKSSGSKRRLVESELRPSAASSSVMDRGTTAGTEADGDHDIEMEEIDEIAEAEAIDEGSVDSQPSTMTNDEPDPIMILREYAEETNALDAEAEYEKVTEEEDVCVRTGNIGFNIGLIETEKYIRQLKEKKLQQQQQQQSASTASFSSTIAPSICHAPSIDELKAAPSLLQIKRKPSGATLDGKKE